MRIYSSSKSVVQELRAYVGQQGVFAKIGRAPALGLYYLFVPSGPDRLYQECIERLYRRREGLAR